MTTPGTDLLTKIPFFILLFPYPSPPAPNSIRFKGNLGVKECPKKEMPGKGEKGRRWAGVSDGGSA